MAHTLLRLFVPFAILGLAAATSASGEECGGAITARRS
mgnify:CR=1 FL=1